MNRDEVKEIVMEILIENEQNLTPRSGRDLFWYALKGVISTWIYMLGAVPIASVWWSGDGWYYCVPMLNETGNEKFREDAMSCVEAHLAETKSPYIEALS